MVYSKVTNLPCLLVIKLACIGYFLLDNTIDNIMLQGYIYGTSPVVDVPHLQTKYWVLGPLYYMDWHIV